MKGELYNYKGQMLSQTDIAKLEGINRSTLADWYKKTGDMIKAVEGAKKSLAQRNIQYYDAVLSLKAISVKENLKFESLKKYYEETNDIYLAVKLTKEVKAKRNGNIEYKGQMLTILAISKLEGLEHHALGRYYERTKDIYESVKLAKEAKAKQNGTILYNGQLMTITGIANLEGIKRDTLKEFYEIYGDIKKAVFITKESQLKRKKAIYKGKTQEYLELAKSFGISTIKLNQLIETGKSIEEIEIDSRKKKKGKKAEEYLIYEGSSLYKYCLEHSYNYWVINYIINNYGKSVEESIKAYLANGQQIPTKWIYEKYSILFKHLTLSFDLDSNRIIKIMKEDNCTIEQAITKLIFISNNQNNDMRLIEIDWLQELYSFLLECDANEMQEAKDIFFISDRELNFINNKSKKIENIKRYLLLFEFSEIVDRWSLEEVVEMFEIYNINDEEIKFIFTELYNPFDGNIINPTSEFLNRKQYINKFVLSLDEDLENAEFELSDLEILYIKTKQNVLKQILDLRNKTNKSNKDLR